jgi:hypothetical protein
MKRRHLLKRAVQAAIGLRVSDAVSAKGAATPPAVKFSDEAGSPPPQERSGGASSVEGVNSETPTTLLDGEWLIATDPQNVGREMRWDRGPVPEAKKTRVPSIIQEVFPAYHGVAWYWREFAVPAHPHPQGRYLIRFGAVDYLADVWVNGVHVGRHEGGETPFVLDATDAVKPKVGNRLAVRVLNPSNEAIDGIVLPETPHLCKVIPYMNGAAYDRGGITESVELSMLPGVRVENLFVRPDWKTGRMRIQANVRNATQAATRGHLTFSVAPAATGETLLARRLERDLPPDDTQIETQLQVEGHRLWDLNDPYLYRLTARVGAQGREGIHETSVRYGFRDFRVEKGYFRLNGKRLFVRSTHTGNHCPIGQIVPPNETPDLLRRDLFYAKASGFNTVRFISGIAHPYQLDLCDEIGLLVYEESMAAWLLKDSPKMKERYDRSIREMVLRDRNHPSLAIWGMLNETQDGPVFREAVSALSIVRSLDDTRLVLLGSGRWDGRPDIGSVSNPGSSEWEHVWGREAPGAAVVSRSKVGGYWEDSGDAHYYPGVPQTPEVDREMRTLGQDSKPVFLSEYGIGSLIDAIHEARMYEQVGARPDTEDYLLMRSMAERLVADWNRWGMDGVYPFPEDMLRDSQRRMARHRLLGFDLIRSNPKICGFNLTGMLDHGMTGEGVWKFWRDWKPGVMDAMQDGWSSLRWCLFVEPTHSYMGRAFNVEAVLANEDVMRPGEYPVRLRICGPSGIAWERQTALRIPQVAAGEDGPLAVPVLREEITLSTPPGVYQFVANLEKGGAPLGREVQFYLSDVASLPRLNQTVTVWGIEQKVENWLKGHEVTCEPFERAAPNRREIILVGGLSEAHADTNGWKELARRMARGSVVVFLSHAAFQREKDAVAWLPLAKKGRCYRFNDWLYHKECVAKTHPIFDGLQGKGILDWYYYGQMIPHHLFDGQKTPDDVAATAFAVGYSIPGGYASGILLGSYRFGEGRFVLNTFPVLENLDVHPAADRLLLNLISYAAGFVEAPLSEPHSGFDAQLRAIGYVQ